MGSKYTEAQKAASIKYLKEKTDDIRVRAQKGTKDRWKAAAEAEDKSLQQFIIDTVEAVLADRDTQAAPGISPETQRILDMRRKAVMNSKYIPEGLTATPEDFRKNRPCKGEE